MSNMQAFCLKEMAPTDLIVNLNKAFSQTPLMARQCVKALNQLVYNINRQKFTEDDLKDIMVIVLKGLNTTEIYLKNFLFIILIELHKKSKEMGIISINSISREIDSKYCIKNIPLRNMGMRCLFTNLPEPMLFDYEKYIRQAILNESSEDNSIILCTEYFKDTKIPSKVRNELTDYHNAFFNSLPVNRYSALLEIEKLEKRGKASEIAKYFRNGTDDIIVIEAAKALCNLNQEVAAPHVEKAVQILRLLLKSSETKSLAAIKILSKLSLNFPSKVARANREIEDLVHTNNKSISMLSILTLLKTGNEESVRKLAIKLEPFLSCMSTSYKMMAIDTMEKLAKNNFEEFLFFLKKSLKEKGDLFFKKYLMRKIENVLLKMGDSELKEETLEWLCAYLEDPEYYQLNMDILGILGQVLSNKKDLMHIYNRLILDNAHVRKCVFQALYDLDKRFDTLDTVENLENSALSSFLVKNRNLKRGKFDMEELGDLKEEVLKYVDLSAEVVEEELVEEKVCRPILLTERDSDFTISVTKKIESENVVLEFEVKNNMENVILNSAVLKISNDSVYEIPVKQEGIYSVSVQVDEDDEFNGVFEYQIALEEDADDVETDSISLIPFNFTVLDFAMPCEVLKVPEKSEFVEMKLNCTPDEATTEIIKRVNLQLHSDTGFFCMSGKYKKIPIVIKGVLTYSKFTELRMEIFCDDEVVLKKG